MSPSLFTRLPWGEYVSPLTARIDAIRDEIVGNAARRGWPLRDGQLDDRHVVRRMILKRVVHGVDKNRMAVELAKVSLWLHSFTVGAPLSFLDHHLRWGDSVVGAWIRPVRDALDRRGALLRPGLISQVERAADGMRRVEESNDSDLTEVARSEAAFAEVEADTTPLAAFFSLLTAERMMEVFSTTPRKKPRPVGEGASERQRAKAEAERDAYAREVAFQTVLDGAYGDPADIAAGLVPMAAVRGKRVSEERARGAALVGEARALAERHRFLHWQIAFPNVWRDLGSLDPVGGFDAVIGNPPYVRQELLGEIKPALRPRPDDPGLTRPRDGDTSDIWALWRSWLLRPRVGYLTFDGVADLYVYFYELGLRLLRPGGRMGYVVTNKWLKAGYAEPLRGLFEDAAWVEFVADFGHAKHFFPDADVFPSILVARRPVGDQAPETAGVCVIPRDAVPVKGVAAVVDAATYPLPRAAFSRQSWTLEPPEVRDLLAKIRRNGEPLAEYAGVKPLYGIKTGFNEAFLIDTPTRDRLVADDPACADIIKRYLRGQDIDRWVAPWRGLWMIFTRRGTDIDRYPSVKRHLERYRAQLEPKPRDWRPASKDDVWPGRKEGNHAWYDIQDTVDYWKHLEAPKILYGDIAWGASFALDDDKLFTNNTGYFIPTGDKSILCMLNAPVGWWYSWRCAQHGKDEALRYFNTFVETYPLAPNLPEEASVLADDLKRRAAIVNSADSLIKNWLRAVFDIEAGRALSAAHTLDADGFIKAVKAVLPKGRRLSAADIAELKREHAATLTPARTAAEDILRLERQLSTLVNRAYGLTPEDVHLMWRTAPPRMPLDPRLELDRMEIESAESQ